MKQKEAAGPETGLFASPVKYRAVKEALKEEILQLNHGDKILPMRDLMKSFAVSQATLERALVELEDENLILRKWGSGIYVNEKEKRKKTGLIGVVVSDVTDTFCSLLVKGIEKALSTTNYRMVLGNGYREFQNELDVIHSLKERVDAVIINPTTPNIHNPEYVEYFVRLANDKTMPFLLVDMAIPGVNANVIGFENHGAFFDIVKRLSLQIPSREIFYLGSFESLVGIERLNGFREGLNQFVPSKENVHLINVSLTSLSLSLDGESPDRSKPKIFFVASPLILPKLIHELHQKGYRLPEEAVIVSVVEENYKDYIYPPVIGLVKPALKLGEESAKIIRNSLQSGEVSGITRFQLEVEIPEVLRLHLNLGNIQHE